MRAERRHEIESLFEAALELPAAVRPAWLADRCGADAELRREVESLLVAHQRTEGLLEERLLDPTAVLSRLTPSYDRVGPYQIGAELGRGGMGIVYRAEDTRAAAAEPVAIKLLGASRYSEKTRKRFEREGRILAALEHPNIARLLQAGLTEDGVPYLAMEYVDGLPIDEYCAQRNLPLDARLRLFRDVTRTVYHAHESNVVHRDLKPSNILVLPDGTAKLLDFGIAKIIASSDESLSASFTESGVLLMTPAYASPEQVLGDRITPATDIYALGAVLYQLLTGRLPLELDGRHPGAIVEAILEEEPRPPSTVEYPDGWPPPLESDSSSDVRRRVESFRLYLEENLDEVVLTALAKEPERRQRSAKRLAEEIEKRL